jgi:hypothetical protein
MQVGFNFVKKIKRKEKGSPKRHMFGTYDLFKAYNWPNSAHYRKCRQTIANVPNQVIEVIFQPFEFLTGTWSSIKKPQRM